MVKLGWSACGTRSDYNRTRVREGSNAQRPEITLDGGSAVDVGPKNSRSCCFQSRLGLRTGWFDQSNAGLGTYYRHAGCDAREKIGTLG